MFFKPTTKQYVIASPMEGVLMKDGEPLPNAKIIRTLRWNGNQEGLTTIFYSNDQGYFSLPAHEETLTLGALEQFAANASFDVELNGKVHELWYNGKLAPELYAETGEPINELICDVDAEEIVVPGKYSNIMTRCRWREMPEDYVITGN